MNVKKHVGHKKSKSRYGPVVRFDRSFQAVVQVPRLYSPAHAKILGRLIEEQRLAIDPL